MGACLQTHSRGNSNEIRMKKGNLTPKDRKRLARLKREMEEMETLAYKHDLDESWAVAGEKLNTRYWQKANEVKRLSKLNG